MAVYQGARPRSTLTLSAILRPTRWPGLAPRLAPRVGTPASPRAIPRASHGTRSVRGRTRVGAIRPRTSSVGLILAAIVVLFSGSFLWLTQSVRVASTNYDIVRLISERDRLEALAIDLRSDIDRLSGEPAVRQEAIDNGLGQLGAPIVVPAR
jgi:hypothetical protein